MKVLVTGAAGFIGYHLSKRLILEGADVVGLDNLNDYYTTNLKFARLEDLGINREGLSSLSTMTQSNQYPNFHFIKSDLCDHQNLDSLFEAQNFDVVIHLAAQAGVRYSLKNPHAYTSSNIEGFLNILEGCRNYTIQHLIFASSSSVYGANHKIPFEVSDRTDHPVSLYAATKKANELMAHTYAHLYGIPCTGLRFFTVYGPLGRPDMAYFKFANLICAGEPIDVYNNGRMARDFTYIDDIVESIIRLIPKPPIETRDNSSSNFLGINGAWHKESHSHSSPPFRVFNIGNGAPVKLLDFIEVLEKNLGSISVKHMLPMQPGDVERTWANVDDLYNYIHYRPKIDIEEGLKFFVDWYKDYYGITKHSFLVHNNT